LNNGKINFYLEEFMIWWGYPEVVLQEKIEDKKQVLQDIFSFWFNKDILIEIKETYKFNNFIKQLSIRNWGLLNLNEISTQVWVSQPTWEHYFDLMFKSLLLYPVRPFFTNKLKEIVKMPKFYFIDNWFRNFLMWRYEFIQDEKWLLFENFIFSELLKKWVGHENIKYWRTKNWVQEVDFILEYSKTAFETKFKDNISKKEFSWLNAFIKDYEWFDTKVISKNNFYDLKI
jgi:predicted AAA+ superfamily ATPase